MPAAQHKVATTRTRRRKVVVRKAAKPVVVRRKTTATIVTSGYGDMPLTRLESYSSVLLRSIKRDLGGVGFFTREDLIQLAAFKHVSTIYRYGIICALVRFLIDRGDIVLKKRTDLCLKDHAAHYNETPLGERYFGVISAVVTNRLKRELFTVMDVVAEWVTDTDLTVNNKRVAVRSALIRLTREGTIVKKDEFQYTTKGSK